METFLQTYPNNLQCIIHKTDTPLVNITVRIGQGIEQEKQKDEGITSLLQHSLLMGTQNNPSKKSFQSAVGAFGGRVSLDAFLDCIEISISALPEYTIHMLHILSELVFEPQLRAADVAAAKEEVFFDAEISDSDLGLVLHDALRRVAFSKTGLAKPVFGRKASLEKLGHEEVRQYHKNALTAQNVSIAIAGQVNEDQVQKWVFDYFYQPFLKTSGKPCQPTPTIQNKRLEDSARQIVIKKNLNQTRLQVGFLTQGLSDKNRHAQGLGAMVLAFMLQEKLSSKDYIYTTATATRSFAENGLVYLTMVCDRGEEKACLKECANVLSDVVRNGLSNADFEAQKALYKTRVAESVATGKMLCRTSLKHLSALQTEFSLGAELDAIEKVSQGECLKALGELFASKPFLAVLGNVESGQNLLNEFKII